MLRRPSMILSGMVLWVACGGCQSTSDDVADQVPPETERASLLAMDRAFAALSSREGYIEAYHRYSSTDVLLLPPGGQPRRGREEIYREDTEEGLMGDLTWVPEEGGVASAGDLGWTWGRWTFVTEGEDGASLVSFGKYFFLWEKVDGAWTMTVNMWNENPDPA